MSNKLNYDMEWENFIDDYIRNEEHDLHQKIKKRTDYKTSFSRDKENVIKMNIAKIFPSRFWIYEYHQELCQKVAYDLNRLIDLSCEEKILIAEEWIKYVENELYKWMTKIYESKTGVGLTKNSKTITLLISFKHITIRKLMSSMDFDYVDQSEMQYSYSHSNEETGMCTLEEEENYRNILEKYSYIKEDFEERTKCEFCDLKDNISEKKTVYEMNSQYIECVVRYIYYKNGYAIYNVRESIKSDSVKELYRILLSGDLKEVIDLVYKANYPASFFNQGRKLKRDNKQEKFWERNYRCKIAKISDWEKVENFMRLICQIGDSDKNEMSLNRNDLEKFVYKYTNLKCGFGEIEINDILDNVKYVCHYCRSENDSSIFADFLKMLKLLEKINTEIDNREDMLERKKIENKQKRKLIEIIKEKTRKLGRQVRKVRKVQMVGWIDGKGKRGRIGKMPRKREADNEDNWLLDSIREHLLIEETKNKGS